MSSLVINDRLAPNPKPSSSKKSYKLPGDRTQDLINLKTTKTWVATTQLRWGTQIKKNFIIEHSQII